MAFATPSIAGNGFRHAKFGQKAKRFGGLLFYSSKSTGKAGGRGSFP
jgi:hypothetical protein